MIKHWFNRKRNNPDEATLNKMDALLRARAYSINPEPRPEFVQGLRRALRQARAAAKPMTSIRLPRITMPRLVAGLTPVLAVIVIAVLVAQPFLGVQTVYAQDAFTLTAEQSDAQGVDPNTSFILESKSPVTVSDIEALLTVDSVSDQTPTLEQVGDRKIRIRFEEPLSADETVKLRLATLSSWPDGQEAKRNYQWAFQVKGDFHVTSAIPGDTATDVPLDSGIEINFNYENIREKDFENAFSIAPAVDGHIESSRKSFVFVPKELKPQTVYTVTISKDLSLEGSDETLGEDYVFSFETSADGERGASFSLDERYVNIIPDEVPAVRYYADADFAQDPQLQVSVYAFDSYEAYRTALEQSSEYLWREFSTGDELLDTKTRQPVISFDASVPQDDSYDQQYLVFPDKLEEGYYFVRVTFAGHTTWCMMAVTPVTAYVSQAVNKTLVWANDGLTNQPIDGAEVRFNGSATRAQTDTSGLAQFDSQNEDSGILEVVSGSHTLALLLDNGQPIIFESRKRYESASGYWSYLYTDRPVYQPSDTIQFWGFVERRADGYRPTQVIAKTDFDQIKLDVNEKGIFAGSFSFTGLDVSQYDLTIEDADRSKNSGLLTSRSVRVKEYVKPAYTLSVTPDVQASFVDQSIGFTVQGTFFEGTPVKGLVVRMESGCTLERETLTLDENGTARSAMTCPYEPDERYPDTAFLEVRPERVEEGDIFAENHVLLFGPKIYLDVNHEASQVSDGKVTVQVHVRNTQAIASHEPEVFGPTFRAGQTITGEITEITHTKVATGESYDFIRKQVVKHYDYDRNEKIIGSFSIVSDASGLASYTFDTAVPDASYEVELTATDENGKVDRRRAYLRSKNSFSYEMDDDRLFFKNDDVPADQETEFLGYTVGQTVHLSVQEGNASYQPQAQENFLYYQAAQGIQQATVSQSSQYAFPFDQNDIPNVYVYGVMYQDGVYRPVLGDHGWDSSFLVEFDQSSAELTIEVDQDQTTYRPGGEVRLGLQVSDKNGDPVEATLNVNVVDEAYYALFDDTAEPLDELYERIGSGVLTIAMSQALTPDSMGAEKGGGGSRELGRHIFKDSAAFAMTTSDASGNATVKFTLPDNITQWRVTTQAMNGENKMAGNNVSALNATQPFFITPVLRESYLVDDQPTILIRSAGTELKNTDQVKYRITIPELGLDETKEGSAADTLRVDLPHFELGLHNITIEATSGSLKDKMTRTVNIVPSRLVRPVIESIVINAGETKAIPGADGRYTTLTFIDGGIGQYYGELEGLASWFGDRADEAMARYVAQTMLHDRFDDGDLPSAGDLAGYAAQGGVSLLPYSTPELALNAKIALFKETPFNEGQMANYFNNLLEDEDHTLTPLEQAMVFAGLAGTGQSVLAEFQRVIPTLPDDVDVQLWAALGLHAAGDDESARQIYRNVVNNRADERDAYIYLPADDADTSVERTAMLAVLAGALNEPQRDAIHDFVLSSSVYESATVLERALYVHETLANVIDHTTSFSYTLGGERHNKTLEHGETLSLMTSPNDRKALDVQATEGKLLVVSRYDTAFVDPDELTDPTLGVKRTYSTNGQAGQTFNEGDLIRVEVSYTLPRTACGEEDRENSDTPYTPCETYQLTDVLPSGLTIITSTGDGFNDSKHACYNYPSSVQNQRVTFFVSQNQYRGSPCPVDRVAYYARVVTPGTYLAEPVYLRSVRDPNTQTHSALETLTIVP